MDNLDFHEECEKLRRIIDELQEKASRAELVEQELRNTYNKLDVQFDKFTRIHEYALEALREQSSDRLFVLISEGVVDIFQLEVGAIFAVDVLDEVLVARGACNLELADKCIVLPEGWLKKHDIWNADRHQALYESPVVSSLWKDLGLSGVIFMPQFNNERHLDSVIMGGITEANQAFYDFAPQEMFSSFMVYCRIMSGIVNNSDALAQARRSARAKNHFLANLSHEIRTPMNAITGMVQLAARSDNLAEMTKFMHQIDLSTKHLLRMLNEVLDIAKIDEGKLSLNHDPFNLRAVVDGLVSTFAATVADKGQTLVHDCNFSDTSQIMGDATRLSQVLLNLLSNAVKFTPTGGRITLAVEEISQDTSNVLIRFSVADTGIGIAQEALQRIFAPFEQKDSGISRDYGGTGLGLAVSQRIVELMGGTIHVDSVEGQGTRFYFNVRFDLAPGDASAPGQDDSADALSDGPPDLSAYRVLIVDDISINREIASALLDNTGIKRAEADNGQQAVDMFMGHEPGYYDCVLMDMRMPVLDGCAASRAIRASGRPDAATIKILAMTANVFKDDVREVLEAGMDGYIAKPVEYTALVKTMSRFLNK